MMTRQRNRALALLPAAGMLLLAGCAPRPPLPVLGQLPEFQLTDQNGHAFDSKQLNGDIWIADFIFTHCTAACPLMSARMRVIQRDLAGSPRVKLVSITVDPARDTPPVLADYARRYEAQPGRWYFLTGPRQRLNDLAFHSFRLNSVDGTLNHSSRFTLVDGRGRIRGYYDTLTDDDVVQKIVRDVVRLKRDRA